MPLIQSVATQLAPHCYSQEEITRALMDQWASNYHNPERILRFQRNVLVGSRHLALPLEQYKEMNGLGAYNTAWINAAVPLATDAVTTLLDGANLDPGAINLIASTTVTGVAVPSLEARLMNTLPFSRQTRRLPLMGLGGLGGVAGINRVCDYLKAYPTHAAILLSVELCSLTHQSMDVSIPNLIASGLFGDGCAAVLMVGDDHPLATTSPLRWINSRSAFFKDTERVMGWDIVDSGFKVVLSPEVPKLVEAELPDELNDFLQSEGYTRKDLAFIVAHPGGPKVLTAMQGALALDEKALEKSWKSLKELGNMSSSSVLFVLKDTLDQSELSGQLGVMVAMGPGFCAELSLLRGTEGQE
ncbi:MAG: 3-oxoacyl-[acyl-carrier-protein] synthase III C-terminal domain-containing protein [Planctomycetota bacterium]|nr:3-oxoacyl-[acyl-carrier-protein] synthase III C-terminal domain-containing protein [Planctomycetota bacterium]